MLVVPPNESFRSSITTASPFVGTFTSFGRAFKKMVLDGLSMGFVLFNAPFQPSTATISPVVGRLTSFVTLLKTISARFVTADNTRFGGSARVALTWLFKSKSCLPTESPAQFWYAEVNAAIEA